jgi:coenzyme PQQ biosynthesis protein PqqD
VSESLSLLRPVLRHGVRYRWDPLRQQHQLVFPEGLLILNETAASIVRLCDGRSAEEICQALAKDFSVVDLRSELDEFLNRLRQRGLVRNVGNT